MNRQLSKFFGATLLIAGCSIGASMIGLPVLSAQAGFIPSSLFFILSWGYMFTTGLLLLEVNLWFEEDVGFVTMAGKTLGSLGKVLAWTLFLYLFYSLLVAYMAGSGALISDFFREMTGQSMAPWIGSLMTALLFSFILYFGTGTVDNWNRFFMAGLGAIFLLLIFVGVPHVRRANLLTFDMKAGWIAVPVMITSFGYHNLVPTVTRYLKHNVSQLTLAIGLGSAIPLLIYLMWNGVMLGIVPKGGFEEALSQGEMATRALRDAVGNAVVVDLAEYFAFFAIITSLLSVALSFIDFLSDGLHIKKSQKGKALLVFLTLAPPYICASLYPKIFLLALRYAGAFGAVILFGMLPVAMVWQGRYFKNLGKRQVVPGGRVVLSLILIASLMIVFFELWDGFL